MSASVLDPVDRHAAYNKSRLFLVSLLALTTAGISASLRASVASDLETIFFKPINALQSTSMIGQALGVAFLGFALTIAIGSPLLDFLGMNRLLPLSSVCFALGTLTVTFAGKISSITLASGGNVFWVIWLGCLLMGLGWGLTETVVNPLIATLYPHEKTEKLNALHAWWPGGQIIGGLVGLGLGQMNFNWQVKLAFTLIPALLTFALCLGVKFPPTERAAAGVPFNAMFRELAKPLFVVFFLAMFLTAASELAPGQWVDLALTRTVGMRGIWLLIYVSGLMFVMRHFAGALVHRMSPVGLLWFSCLLASIGLVLLSIANSPITGVLAATVWGTGVCYMWPTMLATTSERFPRGGALLMGLMGTAGTLSIYFVLPAMGQLFDTKKIETAGGAAAFDALSGVKLDQVLQTASRYSFRSVAVLPALLLIVFGAIWRYDRIRGGYKAEKITKQLV